MTKGRLEAFSDGVIAIIITIMVLEIKVPHGSEWSALLPLVPKLLSYVLSFVFVAVYWNNHHHILQVVKSVNGTVLWANVHLLFWLSLVPFATDWMGENEFAQGPVVIYGGVLVLCALAFNLLVAALREIPGEKARLHQAIGDGKKGLYSMLLNMAGVLLAFVHPWLGLSMYAFTTAPWLVPSKRMEQLVEQAPAVEKT